MSPGELDPAAGIARSIHFVRGRVVILDADLAELYGVPTKRLNEQVGRNRDRFPEDFAFRLSPSEVQALDRSQSATGPQKHRDPRFPPRAFTEHGALAAAFVLSSSRAVAAGLAVVRAFVQLRELAGSHRELARRLESLESKVGDHDEDLRTLYGALRRLLDSSRPTERRRIGFREAEWPDETPGRS